MLSFFRNFAKSRYGLIAIFIVLGIIALAFAAGDVTGLRSVGLSGGRDRVLATVGGRQITEKDVRERIDLVIRAARQDGRNVTMAELLAAGQYENVLQDLINTAALVEYSQKHGIRVTKSVIDGVIAGIPAFQGPDGKFDQKSFDRFLADQRVSLKVFRDDVSDQLYRKWLLSPVATFNATPAKLIMPYASLLLQRRSGTVALIRWQDVDPVAPPDEKALAAFYAANRGRYMVPERRVIRYAMVKADDVKAKSAATDAEIADAYQKQAARFAASEKRSARQLVLLDQATANKVAADVKAGKSIVDEAKGLGLEAGSFTSLERPAFERQSSKPIADAVFAASEGAVIGPIRSPIGWHVVQLDKIEKIPAKSLAQAHDELATEVTQRKTVNALVNLRQAVDDAIGGGATLDEAAAQAKLTVARLGPIAADGTDPDNAAAKPDPAMAGAIRAAFAIQPGQDDPQIAPIGTDGSFALVMPERVIAAAPRPLDQIRKQVSDNYIVDQALKKARAAAADAVKRINAGTPIQQAIAAAGIKGKVPMESFDIERQQLLDGKPRSAGIDRAFTLGLKKADFVPDRDRVGYTIVYVDKIEEHDAKGNPQLVQRVTTEFGPLLPQEQVVQFVESIRRELDVKRNEDAIKKLKEDLARGGTAQQ